MDGISNILENLPRRTDHIDMFRGWSLQRHPRLWQALPAKLQFDLVYSPEAVTLTAEIDALNDRIRTAVSPMQSSQDQSLRQKLYRKRHQLMATVLKKWQASLPGTVIPGQGLKGPTVDHHWTLFGRVRHLLPERDRLSSSLFLVVSPRSQAGRGAWNDMVALGRRRTPVTEIPGMETTNGCCPIFTCAKPMNGCVGGFGGLIARG